MGFPLTESKYCDVTCAILLCLVLPRPGVQLLMSNEFLVDLVFTLTGSEKTSGKVDVKEGIFFGPDVSSDDPDVISGTPMAGVNQFPDERDLPSFANVVKQYRNQMTTVHGQDRRIGAKTAPSSARG